MSAITSGLAQPASIRFVDLDAAYMAAHTGRDQARLSPFTCGSSSGRSRASNDHRTGGHMRTAVRRSKSLDANWMTALALALVVSL